jgi:hypothetical protein
MTAPLHRVGQIRRARAVRTPRWIFWPVRPAPAAICRTIARSANPARSWPIQCAGQSAPPRQSRLGVPDSRSPLPSPAGRCVGRSWVDLSACSPYVLSARPAVPAPVGAAPNVVRTWFDPAFPVQPCRIRQLAA